MEEFEEVLMSPFSPDRWDEDAEDRKKRRWMEAENLKFGSSLRYGSSPRETPQSDFPVDTVQPILEILPEPGCAPDATGFVPEIPMDAPVPPNLFPILRFPEKIPKHRDSLVELLPNYIPFAGSANIEKPQQPPPQSSLILQDIQLSRPPGIMFRKSEEKQRTVGKANGMDYPTVGDVHYRENLSSHSDIDRWTTHGSGLDDKTRGRRKESIEDGKKVGSYSSDLLSGNLNVGFGGDRLDAWAYTIDKEVRNRYVPLGPPETPNKGTKLIKTGKVTTAETGSKAEKIVVSRNGNEKNVHRDRTVTHIPEPIKDKKGKESVDGNGSERPESKASVVSNLRNYSNEMSIKSKISRGAHRLHPYGGQEKLATGKLPESGFTSQGTIIQSSKCGDRGANDDADDDDDDDDGDDDGKDEEDEDDSSKYTNQRGSLVDGSLCHLLYEKECRSGGDPRSVLLINEPQHVAEEIYKVQTSCETLKQTQKSTHIFKIPRDIVLEDGYYHRVGCCCKPNSCGIPKNCLQKPLFCEKSFSPELDEHVQYEKKRMHYAGRCLRRETFCCRDEPLHLYECCGPPGTGYLHHFCRESPKEVHQIEKHCLHSLMRTKSNEKKLGIFKKMPCDCMVQVYGKSSVDHVSHGPSRSEDSCGSPESRRGCHCDAFSTSCNARPVSVIPSIRKHSTGKQFNWQLPQQHGKEIHKHRPKSAIFPPDEGIKKTISANISSAEKKYCLCSEDTTSTEQRQSLVAEKDATSAEGNLPTESDDYHTAEGKQEYLLNKYIQRPLKKKKIMKICNCPHLHLEENTIKKFCIHQCSNNKKDSKSSPDGKNQSPGKEKCDAGKTFHDAKSTNNETSDNVPKQDKSTNRKNMDTELTASPDPKNRLLIKSTSALLVPNKDGDDKRAKESLRDRMPPGESKNRKCSVGTATTESKQSDVTCYKTENSKPKLEQRNLNRKTQSTQANDKEKKGRDFHVKEMPSNSEKDATNLKFGRGIKLKNVFTKTDKDNIFNGTCGNAYNGPGNGDRYNGSEGLIKKDGLIRDRSDGKTIPKAAQEKRASDKEKSLNLVKLYEDLVEFQKVFNTSRGRINPHLSQPRKEEQADPNPNGSPGDAPNEDTLRKRLRCKLALHLHQLLRISDDTVQLV